MKLRLMKNWRNRYLRPTILLLLMVWLVIGVGRSMLYGWRIIHESSKPIMPIFPLIGACSRNYNTQDIGQVVMVAYRSLGVQCEK
jgi:hypothetical protein